MIRSAIQPSNLYITKADLNSEDESMSECSISVETGHSDGSTRGGSRSDDLEELLSEYSSHDLDDDDKGGLSLYEDLLSRLLQCNSSIQIFLQHVQIYKESSATCRKITESYGVMDKKLTIVITSDDSIYVRKSVPYRLATMFPCKFSCEVIGLLGRLTSVEIQKLIKSFCYKQVTCQRVSLVKPLQCGLEEFLELMLAEQLQSHVYLDANFFNFPFCQNLTVVCLQEVNRMTDRQFLSLRAEELIIRNDTISDKALNILLKFTFDETAGLRDRDAILADISANLCWSPESHEHSLLSMLPIQDLREMWIEDPAAYYFVWRVSDFINHVDLKLFQLELSTERLFFCRDVPEQLFKEMLNPLQYCIAFHSHCRSRFTSYCYCWHECCKSRKYFSPNYYREMYPKWFDGFISVVAFSRILLSGYIIYTGDFNVVNSLLEFDDVDTDMDNTGYNWDD